MNGLLSDHPLVELINEISEGRLSGVLRLSRERAKGAVYFEEGRVVNALTNLRAYRLTESLRRGGAVGAAKLDAVLRPEMTDEAAGAALVAGGLLSAEELRRLRERLAAEVLRQLLQWGDGEWSFDARVRLEESQRAPVEAGRLLVEAARRLAPAFAAKSFRDAGERLSPAETASQNGSADGGPQLQPLEAFVLSRFDAPLSLSELSAVSGLPDEETRKAVYVLALGGLLRRDRPRRALAEAVAAATAPKKTNAQAAAPPHASAAGKPTAPTKPNEDAKPPAPRQAEAQAKAEDAAQPSAAQPKDPREELAELFERAEGSSHYEVLGVGRLSKPDEIKRAYYALARRFHPDRFRQTVSDDAERQRVEVAFAKIAQAYDVLKDSAQRAAYDLKLSASRAQPTADAANAERKTEPPPRAGDDAPPPQAAANNADPSRRAEDLFRAGQAALGKKDYAAATKCLGEAVLLDPQQARYRAYFGRLLARDKATRRQAEVELQTAVSLDARNVSYRLMLAELYRDVGLRRRAEAELEQVLAIDRTNDPARRLLEELRKGS